MSKSTKPAPSFRIPEPGAPQPLTAEQRLRQAYLNHTQTFVSSAQGILYNILHSPVADSHEPAEIAQRAIDIAAEFTDRIELAADASFQRKVERLKATEETEQSKKEAE